MIKTGHAESSNASTRVPQILSEVQENMVKAQKASESKSILIMKDLELQKTSVPCGDGRNRDIAQAVSISFQTHTHRLLFHFAPHDGFRV